jgi:VWFA-related protein
MAPPYRDGTFTDVTGKAGLAGSRYGIGAAVGDYDNDGRPDIFVANVNENRWAIMSAEVILKMPRVASVRPQVMVRLALAFVPLLFQLPARAQTGAVPGGAAVANPSEVTVDLTAHDKKGNLVPDLKPSEVEITDGGAAVSLTSLRPAGHTQETITFLFDQVDPGVAKTDRGLARDFLTAAAGHGYLFMVLKVEGRLHLVQAPTADVEAVTNAIEAITMAKRPDYIKVTEAAEKQMSDDLQSASGARQATAKMLMAMLMDSQKTATDPQYTASVAALLAASRGQRDVPGRKALLYFSAGLDWHKSSPETLRGLMQAANRARVSVYSFDAGSGDSQVANSLAASTALGTSQAMGGVASGSLSQGRNASPSAEGPGAGAEANELAGRMQSGDSVVNSPKSLTGICQSTGGVYVAALGGGGHKGAIEIATDLNSYYLASWISPSSGDENSLRPITVKSLRKGVVVESRAGYYAARGSSVARVSAVEGRLTEALAAPKLPADLPFNATVLRYGNTTDNDVNSVVVQVPLTGVGAKGDQGNVSVLAQLKDHSGAVVRKFSADIAPRPTIGDQGQSPQDVVTFRRQFSAPPGEYVLESAAFDANGGKIGAQRANVVIPAVAHGLALGDVLVVRRFDAAESADDTDPMRCAEGIVVPNLSGHVSKAASPKIDLFFDLHTDPAATETPSLSAELRRDGGLLGSLPLKLPADPNRKTIPYVTTLGANSLPTGRYQMTIILSQGGQKVSRSVSFILE